MKFFNKISFLSLLFIVIFGVASPQVGLATEGETPFGGFTVLVINCTCTNNYLIFHLPAAGPSPIVFSDFFSKLYEFGKIKQSGVWILGNVKTPVACRIHVGHHCVSLGEHPLITIVGTSDPAKLAQSGRDADSSTPPPSSPRPDPQENIPPETNPTTPCGAGNVTPADQGQTEQQVRSDLRSNGVLVAPDLSSTLSPVSKLPNNAIAGVEDLARDCGSGCQVMITSGARQPGNPTPPGSHGTGKPVFDLNKNPGLDRYIVNNASSNYTDSLGTHYRMPNGDEYLDENYGTTGGTGEHWHVRINANHMTQC